MGGANGMLRTLFAVTVVRPDHGQRRSVIRSHEVNGRRGNTGAAEYMLIVDT